jgi:hypothetical protein
MTRWFSSLTKAERRAAWRRLLDTLNDLLGLGLAAPLPGEGSWETCLEMLSREVWAGVHHPDYPLGTDETAALIAALAEDKDRSMESFLTALAEILFIERERRSEYVENRLSVPPFKISLLLLEYATKMTAVDRLMDELCKEFCRDLCPKSPVGCCNILGYDMGLVPDRMLAVQKLEASMRGWRAPKHPDLTKCRYHRADGCALVLFKSPACIGYLCEGIETDLAKRFDRAALERFYRRLAELRNCDIDRREVFRALDALIDAGARLIA